ncbi:hypothetical protein BN1723_006845 [Verticillium longisporum]|uniref:J domain-containing protein n=2 Tax=Verticillium longisporum TaxID=100787 RepID=A0A0G4NI59_VERLO|nr:hypothetical protein BN1723_006845 [Verticillium longisporum]
MDTKDLTQKATEYASQHIDLYALIALDPATTDAKQIHRAWRKSSLLHHPDKAGDAFDPEKWALLESARDVLLDATARGAYDRGREAQALRAAERAQVQGARKRMIDELEAAEGEAKRRRDEQEEKRRELEREKARMGEELRRRRAEEDERRKGEQEEKRRELEREKARMGEELRRRRAEEDERFRREAEEKRNREEDEGDERIQELQRRLEETRRRKAEKKARKRGELPPETESKDAPKTNGGEGKAPKWEDLKARMIAVQKKRDAAKLVAAQEAAAGTAEDGTTA